MIKEPPSTDIIRVTPDFHITINPTSSFSMEGFEERINTLWVEESQKRPLFDGNILGFIEGDESVIHGEFIPYRAYVAQLLDPTLEIHLQICPMAVSGIVIVNDTVLIARRATTTTQYPGYYELIPSGSITPSCCTNDDADFRQQIIEELYEETGLDPLLVQEVTPFALIRDKINPVIDICTTLKLKTNKELVIHQESVTEYSEFIWLPFDEIESFTKENKHSFVPTSLAILSLPLQRH
jgi:hypothetical protein